MAGKPRPRARQAFNDNIADAEILVQLARSLQNRRTYKMRAEKRLALGTALGIAKKRHAELDCIESEDVFAVFPRVPGSPATPSARSRCVPCCARRSSPPAQRWRRSSAIG